ncbi:branched-chain alpha-keto acid dehydrogenase subunit E2 [Kocuria flava]|uniref:Dihydrolipoamide acetyltransferase component of pyruvate dehydrogenase complex n=1 Tax=Kocuria flava TaxID=446860 RepID=A0A0U3HB86_9MICC|nr:dihydrolipoamide acetyltransferase family protein [Kocuria flava]ALU38409.1 branched-chain alpha-keto acid dehydrogenase subunit E2 [Kocuria flava]GEO92892.1 dihydrolipoamide acetyltransferase component of pyruvate dehydrogenase complex [Kocuria flava]
MPQIFELPDVGEGLTEAEILAWRVAPGESVRINQVLVEIETAKSVVELPSPYAGTVLELLVPEGRTVEVGTPIIAVGSPEEVAAAPAGPAADGDAGEGAARPAVAEDSRPLVGSGPRADPVRRRRRVPGPSLTAGTAPAAGPPPEPARPAGWSGRLARGPLGAGLSAGLGGGLGAAQELAGRAARIAEDRGVWRRPRGEEPAGPPPRRPTLAKPPVRMAARDLGIDLADVPATGASGQITKQDLLAHAARLREQGARRAVPADDARIERIPVRGVRKATAQNMVRSAFGAPHASVFVDVDATRTMEFVRRLRASPDYEGVKVTPLLVLAKAVLWAVERHPQVNATWTDEEILVKHFVHLGIAAATPRGLMVPNLKDAQDLSLRELAEGLEQLTTTARAGRTQPADMQNGTITITNIGPLGLDTGTPIINPGEVAIIAFGSIKQKPWVVDGAVVPRWVTTLGGSFDHRVVDGDLAGRFTADVARILEEPALLLD